MVFPLTASLVVSSAICAGAIAAARAFHRYCLPAQYENVGKRYGLKRARWEPINVWEDRIWRVTERRLDTSEALTNEALAAGSISYFPPRQRPPMPAGVTWTTGIDFACGLPFVVWLPDEHPIAAAFRAAHEGPTDG